MNKEDKLVTFEDCDSKHKSMRTQFIFYAGFLSTIMLTSVWAIRMSYGVEKRFNIHEAVEKQTDKYIAQELQEIKKIVTELKENKRNS